MTIQERMQWATLEKGNHTYLQTNHGATHLTHIFMPSSARREMQRQHSTLAEKWNLTHSSLHQQMMTTVSLLTVTMVSIGSYSPLLRKIWQFRVMQILCQKTMLKALYQVRCLQPTLLQARKKTRIIPIIYIRWTKQSTTGLSGIAPCSTSQRFLMDSICSQFLREPTALPQYILTARNLEPQKATCLKSAMILPPCSATRTMYLASSSDHKWIKFWTGTPVSLIMFVQHTYLHIVGTGCHMFRD